MAEVMPRRVQKRQLQLESDAAAGISSHGAQRRRVQRGSSSSAARGEQHDEEEDDEYHVSDGEHADGVTCAFLHTCLRVLERLLLPSTATAGHQARHAGSEAGDSLDDCESVPSDELLDLVDECSASESEVRSAGSQTCLPDLHPCCATNRGCRHGHDGSALSTSGMSAER